MPETLLVKDFSAGWCPSDDDRNGRSNALLQMDNLELDKNGALTMTGGTVVKNSSFPANAHSMFSRYMAGSRKDYAALADGTVYRNSTSIGSGGDTLNAGFSTAFDFTLIASGAVKLKDNGTTAVNLGVLPPTLSVGAAVNSHNAPFADFGRIDTNWVVPTGLGSATWNASPGSLAITTDGTTGIGVVQTYPGSSHNTNTLTGTAGTGVGTDRDFVIINFGTLPTESCLIQLDVLLVSPNASGDQVTDFYTYTVGDIRDLATWNGLYGSIRIARKDFVRVGNGGQDWSTVYGYRISIQMFPGDGISVWGSYLGYNSFNFQGSSIAQWGNYDYVQVNVNNTGSYIAKSVIGPIAHNIVIDGANALITPQSPSGIDSQVNEVWIYRRGGELDQWYRVLVFLAAGSWAAAYDPLSDSDALALGITINLNLISVRSLPDKVYEIVGPIEGRWFYFTTNMMYPSDINDPDLVDSSKAVRTTGSNSELFMWAKAIAPAVVLVGTSADVYILTGTFQTFPDNSIDIYYNKTGIKYPPITYDAAVYESAVYYLSSDGWRVCTTSNQQNQLLVAPNTDRLYRGETCYGYSAPNLKIAPGSARFPVVIARNKLWCFIQGVHRIEVYDFLRKYWFTISYGLGEVSAACDTQDAQILAFFGTDKKTREVAITSSKLIDATTKQTISALGVFFDNGQPRQRKDTYTFKSRCFTGAATSLTVKITNDANTQTTVSGSLTSSTNATEQFLDLSATSAFQLTKLYQVLITGQVADCTIEDWSIDFDARPVPVTFLRFVGLNYGTTSRKRLYSIPFQIDTLSHNVLVTPTVDGTAKTGLTVNSSRKQSFDYQFLISSSELNPIGTDYEWTIDGQGNEFEWYGFQELKNVEVFPERRQAHVIPITNFGSTARKRLRVRRFILDCISTTVSFTPMIDGVLQAPVATYTGSRKTCFYYYTDDQIGVDFSGLFSAPGPFELIAVLDPQEGDIEVFPERVKYLVVPTTNFGSPVKKRVRGWPFVINTFGLNVTATEYVDGVALSPTTIINTSEKRTIRLFYKTDVFGIDYSVVFSGNLFELWTVHEPDVVQVLPPARQFDQVGPQEFLRFGKLIKMELRVLPFSGTSIPVSVLFADAEIWTSTFTVVSDVEDSYFMDIPKGVSGRVLRVELGPTDFNMHRYYMRFLMAPSGGQEDTENQWITIPNMASL